tara:strand:- start:305 stop:967 length:663 start_codon:yes stop_codon:yes gene_type:complete
MSLQLLPPELIDMIADAACKVRTNGKSSSNLRVIIRTQHLPSSCQEEAVRWVLRCLEDRRLEYAKDELGQYPWKVVSNVVNEREAPEHSEYGSVYPELVVAIRIGQVREAYLDHGCDEDRLVVLNENPPFPELEVNADIFKEIVKDVPPPPFITAVGISAVSDEFMMALWSDIIAEEPGALEGKGKGYMVHPMWMRMPDAEWLTVREQSFNFGWKGYNPS